MAYPTYYRKLFVDLREEMTAAVKLAQQANKGVWSKDQSQSGAKVTGLSSLTDEAVILPKLFRRLVAYLDDGNTSLDGFEAYLEHENDRLFVLTTGQWTGFGTVVQVTNGNTVRMTEAPENLVFDEK
ncbi:hypothetical protein ACFWIY_17585 [Streptomyces sioyaensis]|uniref:hypothetical protein n=1 Tax=Streptomyces sioyaensis TaxID=67364 RepID=UPI0036676C88